MKNEIKHTSESVMGAFHRCLAGSGETIKKYFRNALLKTRENKSMNENERDSKIQLKFFKKSA